MTLTRPLLGEAGKWLFLGTMVAGTGLIAWASVPYFFGDELPEFIVQKLPLPHEALWLAALHVHVAAALFGLPACLALLSRRLVRRRPAVHRWLGRSTAAVLLLALVPSGAWLALYATGGWPSTLGFLVSGAIVLVQTGRGIRLARRRDVAGHRRAIAHVVAQMSVAVTSRGLLVAFDRFGVDPALAYAVALWLPVLASALAAQLLFRPRFRRNHEGRRVLAAPV